jgi:hypothetical protein
VECTNGQHPSHIEHTQYGTPIQPIDATKTLRIVAQNTQYALQLTNYSADKLQAVEHLHNLQASIFMNISPNVNWMNPSNWVAYKRPFQRTFQQIHISATSSDIGLTHPYKDQPVLIGGVAIVTTNHWASKVSHTSKDHRGHGTFSTTTYAGKNGKKLTVVAAYISVKKELKAGENTLHHQQTLLMEQEALKNNTIWNNNKCPRKEAIKALSQLIGDLQQQGHSIILAIDANQTPAECFSKSTLKPFSIEWLRQEHAMSDPFSDIFSKRPSTTTVTPNRDIDYIFTHNVPVSGISLLNPDLPAPSDHFGIIININIAQLFDSTYSELADTTKRRLTVDNVQAKSKFSTYVTNQFTDYTYWERSEELILKAVQGAYTDADETLLEELDLEITTAFQNGDAQCAHQPIGRDPWSPKLRIAGRVLSYWKRKKAMLYKRHINWHLLNQKRIGTEISEKDHLSLYYKLACHQFIESKRKWKEIKCNADKHRESFLSERAEEMSNIMHTTHAKALKAIKYAESSKREYRAISNITGHKKDRNPLTQAMVPSNNNNTQSNVILTDKTSVEQSIISRNQHHAHQSLQTPFAQNPTLAQAIDPAFPQNQIENILQGTFLNQEPYSEQLTTIQQ